MTNQPLTSNEQGKLLIFSLLLLPSLVFIFGVIPAIFLAFGIYMMKKNQDFSNIDTAVKNFKIYMWFALIGCFLSSVYWGCKYFASEKSYYSDDYHDELFISLIFLTIAFAYLVVVQILFYTPLRNHSEWVSVNGIFSAKPRSVTTDAVKSKMDIIKGEKLKQYSVADELIKWAKLKEDGHISEEEFSQARDKLLK